MFGHLYSSVNFGVQVMVVTTHEGVPQEFYGAKLIGSRRLHILLSFVYFFFRVYSMDSLNLPVASSAKKSVTFEGA